MTLLVPNPRHWPGCVPVPERANWTVPPVAAAWPVRPQARRRRAEPLTLIEHSFYRWWMQEQRGRWWNRRYGRMARKDLWLWHDGPQWIVGAREGDADARVWRREFGTEAAARALIDQILARNGGRKAWLDMTQLTSRGTGS